MKLIRMIFVFTVLLVGCDKKNVQLNDITESFKSFQETDSLHFIPITDEIIGEPMKMLYIKEHLLLRINASPGDSFLVNYSLKDNKIVSKAMKRGNGPNEMINCDISFYNDNIWLYDVGKQKIGKISTDSVIEGKCIINQYYKVPAYYYNTALLNDSILIGTNDFTSSHKLSYLNIKSGEKKVCAPYAYLNEQIPISTLIDASSCYINIHPQSKDILLSYRYTDIIEIYDQYGNIKKALKGPDCFDAIFSIRSNLSMGKTRDTRKAFVNSYTTEKYIYLLYSGCKRSDENWANGTQLFVFSWDGKPLRRYILDQPIYAFAVNDLNNELYSYSLQTGELLKTNLR